MQVEILYMADCPNLAAARARVQEALVVVGAKAHVREVEVATPGEAQRLGMRGSPTILVEGRDPFDAAGPSSLSCRLYPTDGAFEGAPSVSQLVEALGG